MKRILILILMLAACNGNSDPINPPPPPPPPPPGPLPASISLELVTSAVTNPLYLTAPPSDQVRLFVVEKAGRIRIIRNGQVLATPFLDITSKVQAAGNEQGLFSIAFHPNYANNGWFFVNYTDRNGIGNTQVERYTVTTANPDVADPASAVAVINVQQPAENHNGGQLQFGPDGNLYIGMGDGGHSNDVLENAQNRATLLGDMLRLNVDQLPYTIPASNPYAGSTQFRREIWAYGLRNPWRFSFDPETSLLYVADVGQNMWEEINAVSATQAGVNYGWNTMEGAHCFQNTNCNQTGLQLPVHEFNHPAFCSVVGGYVYRGSRVPGLVGHYFYSDLCDSRLRSFRLENGVPTDHRIWSTTALQNIVSFGVDGARELYVMTLGGRVYRIAP